MDYGKKLVKVIEHKSKNNLKVKHQITDIICGGECDFFRYILQNNSFNNDYTKYIKDILNEQFLEYYTEINKYFDNNNNMDLINMNNETTIKFLNYITAKYFNNKGVLTCQDK
jgi:hypothetical protein